MTNKELIDSWKTLSIEFNSGLTQKMVDMFLLCWGETKMDMEGNKESVVVFDQGGEMGTPALFCQSDVDDNCWAFGWNEEKKTGVKSKIGKFIKNKKTK